MSKALAIAFLGLLIAVAFWRIVLTAIAFALGGPLVGIPAAIILLLTFLASR